MFYKETLVFASGGRSNFRIPSVVSTKNGTVIAFCNDRKDTLSDAASETALSVSVKKPNGEWSAVKDILGYPGWACGIGSAVYDAETDTVMCQAGKTAVTMEEFGNYTKEQLEERNRKAKERAKALGIEEGSYLICTKDGGDTWEEYPFKQIPVTFSWPNGETLTTGSWMHGSSHGIQLRHGEHKGRLICPTRFGFGGRYTKVEELRNHCCNNATFSDDHGKTWYATEPVQVGTGEGTLVELGDGTLLYNSRAYYADTKRYLANSTDGGMTWGNFRTDDFLIEDAYAGCNASFLRVEKGDLNDPTLLPDGAESMVIFANPRATCRENMTLCISFDEGKTYAKTKTVWAGPAAYSSLEFCAADQHFYLMYEKGEEGQKNPYKQGISIAEFDVEWMLSE